MTVERVRADVPREAAGLGGVAWTYLALHSGSIGSGTAALSAAASVLTAFRELFNDNRSAVVDALAALRIVTAEQANATLPRSLPPSATLTRADITALAISLYPIVELSRLASASRVASTFQGEALETVDAPNWGTAEDLRAIFAAAPAGESGLNAWFTRFTSVWSRSSSDPYARQLWWFATTTAAVPAAQAGAAIDRTFTNYVFTGDDAAADRSTITQQAREVAPAASIPSGGSVSLPPEVELSPTVITARAGGRSAWMYFLIAAAIAGVGGLSWYVWFYRQRSAKPWRK